MAIPRSQGSTRTHSRLMGNWEERVEVGIGGSLRVTCPVVWSGPGTRQSAEPNLQLVRGSVIDKRQAQRPVRDDGLINHGKPDPASDAIRVLHSDHIARRAVAKRYLETRPRPRDARIEMQDIVQQAQPENTLDTCSLHPSG